MRLAASGRKGRDEATSGATLPTAAPASLPGHAAKLRFALPISGSFSLGARAAPFIDPAALDPARFPIAAAALGAVAAPSIRRAHFRAPWRHLALGGLIGACFVLMFKALKIADPVSTDAVFTLKPILSAGSGWLLMRQVTTGRTALSLGLAGAGALRAIFRGDLGALLALRIGEGERLFFVGCAAHALWRPLGRKLNRGEPLLVFTFGALCGGLAATGFWGARAIAATDRAGLPPVAWLALLCLALATTAATAFLVQFATLRLPAAKAMARGYLLPAFVSLREGLSGAGRAAPAVWVGAAATAAALLLLLKD